MTVTADNQRRVILRTAKPGDRFDLELAGDGKLILTRLVPDRSEVLDLADLDARTMAPKGGRITRESIVKAVRADREHQR